MKKMTLLAVVLCALTVPMYAKRATVKIINQSKWEIHHIYLSSSEDQEWGPDQLEDETLAKGESLTLTGIECDTYDIQVVDEDGDECVIEQVELCGDNSYWKITDKALLECEGYR
jgi:cell division protein FtsL